MHLLSSQSSFFRLICGVILLSTVQFASAQNIKTYNVGMMVDASTQETAALYKRLVDETQSVVGKDAIINFPQKFVLENNFNVTKAKSNYNTLVNDDVDIILAIGSTSNIVIQEIKEFKKPTILFGLVNSDTSKLNLQNATSGIENFTYLMGVQSYKDDIGTFQELTKFKKLGIAIEKGVYDSMDLKKVFDPIFDSDEITYKLLPFKNVQDITSQSTEIDALYLAGGFYLNSNDIVTLASYLEQKNIPSFTSTGSNDVASGLMATNNSNDNTEQLIRRIALTIEAYVTGTSLAEQKVYIEVEAKLSVNYNVMQRLGVNVRYSLIDKTEFIGEFKNELAAKNYSLLDVINDNLNQNLDLKAQEKDVALSGQDVKIAKSNYYPSINANASFTNIDERVAFAPFSPENSTDGNIQLNQTIYSEAANANISIQKNLQQAQQAQLDAAQLDAVFRASNLYFNALVSKVNVKIQSQNLQLTKENLKIAKQNFEAGQSGKSDMLRFKSQMAQNTQSLVEAVNQLEQSYIAINQLLNNDIDYELDVKDAELGSGVFINYNYQKLAELLDNPELKTSFVKFIIEEGKRNSPELKALDFNLKAVERNFKLNSMGRFIPTVALQANFNQNFNQWGVGSQNLDPANNYNVGLSISIPLIDRFRNNIDKQTASIQKDQLQINKENIELAIEGNLSTAVLNVVNQISNIRLSEVSATAAEEALDLVQTSYSEGAVSIIQLIDAQNNYLQAQLSQANATYNFLLNTIQLERFMGYNFLLHSDDDNEAFEQRFIEFLNTRQ